MLQLESLANELLLDIFEYLDTAGLVRAFFGLNSRFDHLLYTDYRNQDFNLRSIAKDDFDVICKQHLPILINNIISLHLSNDTETPNLCELFLSRGFTFDRFIHLKTLSLYHIYSFNTINQIIIQCRCLSHLNHLNLIDCHTDKLLNNTAIVINNIWSLPKLTHCIINDIIIQAIWLYKLSVVSSSIEYLSIRQIDSSIYILHNLFKYTPHLRRLNINVTRWIKYDRPGFIFSSLISLKTSFESDIYSMNDLFKRLPNLCYLTLETRIVRKNGYDWEELLVNHLPKIKIFRLKMNLDFPGDDNIIEQIDQLVDSFRTSFWLEKHQWYIRCDCYRSVRGATAALYTLPYAFNECSYLNTHYSKSTKPDDEEFCPYDHVQFVQQNDIRIYSFNDLTLFNTRFPNIRHFKITLPLIDNLDSYNLSFDQLTSLNVKLNNVFGYNHLQMLLDRAHRLYSLQLYSFGDSPAGIFQLTNSSIRRLELMAYQHGHGVFFNNEECINLINSPLGRQCEVLLIGFENPTNIFDVIEKMPHLRILTFRCKDIMLNYLSSLSIRLDFIPRLQHNLSSKSSIITDPTDRLKTCIWIYRKTKQSVSTNDFTKALNDKNTLLLGIRTTIRRLFH